MPETEDKSFTWYWKTGFKKNHLYVLISLLFHDRILLPRPENAGVTVNLSSKFIRTVLVIEAWCAKSLKWPPGLSLRFLSLPSSTHNSKTEQLWSSGGGAIPVYPMA